MDCYSSRMEKPRHPNWLSEREMEALAAVCDTLLPSIDVSGGRDEDMIAFYGTSASMLDIPDKVIKTTLTQKFKFVRRCIYIYILGHCVADWTVALRRAVPPGQGPGSRSSVAAFDVARDVPHVWPSEPVENPPVLPEICKRRAVGEGEDPALMVVQLLLPLQDALQVPQVSHSSFILC